MEYKVCSVKNHEGEGGGESIHFASFDIGERNFAFYIESVDMSILKKICKSDSLDCVYKCGKAITLKNFDIKGVNEQETLNNCIDLLDTYKSLFEKCSVFVIEKQMFFKSKMNLKAVKLAQTCYTWILINIGRYAQINVFPAYHKTQVLGAGTIKVKYTRKKWSTEKALYILRLRGNEDSFLSELENSKKKDDMADCITQLQAFKFLMYIK